MQASKDDVALQTSDVPHESDLQQSRSESDPSSVRTRTTAVQQPKLDSSSQMTELQLAQRQAAALAADRRAAAQARRDARSAPGGSGAPTEHDAAAQETTSSVATEGAAVKAAVPEAAPAEAAAEAAKVTIRYAGLAPRSKARLEVLLNDWAAWHAENVQHSNDGSQLLVSIMRQVEVGFPCCCAHDMMPPLLQSPITQADRSIVCF